MDIETFIKECPEAAAEFENLKKRAGDSLDHLENLAVLKFMNRCLGTDMDHGSQVGVVTVAEFEVCRWDSGLGKCTKAMYHKPTGQKLLFFPHNIWTEDLNGDIVVKVELPVEFHWSDGSVEKG